MATFSPGEVSNLLDVPSSTLRRYVSHFGDYLSEDARRKRSRRFTEQDIQVIAQIRDLTGQGIRLEDIPQRLDQTVDVDQPREEMTALALPGVLKQLEGIAELFTQQQQEINQLRDQLSSTAGREDIEQLQQQIQELHDQLDRERNKPWYKRILGV